MGQRRNKGTCAVVEPTLTSILNSGSSHRSIEKGSRKTVNVKNNGNDNGDGTAPLNDITSTRLRNRGKKPGKENAVETEAEGENPSIRRSRRIQSKNVGGTLGNDNKENLNPCGAPISSSTEKRKRAVKSRSDVEASQVGRSKRNRVAGFSTVNIDDACLRKHLGEECEVKGANGPSQRPLSPGTGADAVETCSNSVPTTPAVNVTPELHLITDDDGIPNARGMKDKPLQNFQNNDANYDHEDDGNSIATTIAEMQKMYSKLHAKYRKLKARKLDGVEDYIEQQTEKFNTYISVAEGLLEHLRNDNNRLRSETNESAALNRLRLLEHQNAECQSDLLVERSKNLALLKEVEKLGQLLSDQKNMNKQAQNTNHQDASTHFSSKEKSVVLQPERQEAIVDLSCTMLQGLSKNCTSRFKEAMVQTEVIQNTCYNCCPNSQETLKEPENRWICNKPARGMAIICSQAQRDKPVSEDTLKGDSSNVGCERANSLFQMLLQCMLGLQFSIVNERDKLQVLALHESSGFSFTLSCLTPEDDPKLEENGEVIYRSVSLGALQKLAPDWMKEEIVFSTGQVNIFFDRILQVANGRGNNLFSR